MSKTLCISDIHLGSPVCKTNTLLDVLTLKKWDKIIINGDLIDNGHFKRFSKQHWEILKILRKKSKNLPVILVEGNHDVESNILCEILGLEFVEKHTIIDNLKKIVFMHGHQFDFFIKNRPLITNFFAYIYYLIQRIDKKSILTRIIKKKSKAWLNASELVANRAIKYAKNEGYTDIVCGHVHQAGLINSNESGDPAYWNTGTFCDSPSHYLEITDNFKIELNSL